MPECCIHCRLNDIAEPPFDEIVGEWPAVELLPRWLTSDAPTWVPKEVQVIPVMQLGDGHLYNIDRMLGRSQTQGDEADEEGHPIGGGPPMDLFDIKSAAIEEEMDRRKIPKGVPA